MMARDHGIIGEEEYEQYAEGNHGMTRGEYKQQQHAEGNGSSHGAEEDGGRHHDHSRGRRTGGAFNREQRQTRDVRGDVEADPTAAERRREVGRGSPDRRRERPRNEDVVRNPSRGAFDTFHEWDIESVPFLRAFL